MKKFLCLILVFSLFVLLVACGGEEKNEPGTKAGEATETQPSGGETEQTTAPESSADPENDGKWSPLV